MLGPLWIEGDDGRPVSPRGARVRALLGVLLTNVNQFVSVDTVARTLWDGRPPRTCRSNIQTCASAVRRLLDEATPGGRDRLAHGPGGYRLSLAEDELDLLDFRHRVEQGRRDLARGDRLPAARALRAALALWRGRALEDVTVAGLAGELLRLEEERHGALEDCAEAELALGRHGELIPELRAALTTHPLRERLRGQLMVALTRAGRQSEALETYREGRTQLIAELGIEPGATLTAVHDAVLRGEVSAGAVPDAVPGVVCQLPRDVDDFTGRDAPLAELVDWLAEGPGAAVRIAVLSGPPGVGKTALAVHAAHRLRTHLSDGQLYVDLRGSSASPRDPAEVLVEQLVCLGTPRTAVPAEAAARAALLRARLADRRFLIVLDDAVDAEQVEPLIPGTATCAVLVTTRTRQGGPAGARRFDVGPLSDAEALALLGRVAGDARVSAGPDAAGRLVAACENLPLALRGAATWLAARPAVPIRVLADRLPDECDGPDQLSPVDRAIRRRLDASVRRLPAAARSLLLALAATGVTEFEAAVVDAAAGSGGHRAADALVDASLLDLVCREGSGRLAYRIPELVRRYAAEVVIGGQTWAGGGEAGDTSVPRRIGPHRHGPPAAPERAALLRRRRLPPGRGPDRAA